MSKKIYVLDTNVILYAGKKALTSFEDNEVVIPFVVVEELEKKRLEDGLVGAMARYALREIEKLRSQGSIKDGVVVNQHGGKLRIEMNHTKKDSLPEMFLKQTLLNNDIRVLCVAHNLHLDEMQLKDEKKAYREVILLTNDLPLRIKADAAFGMTIQPFWSKGNLYSGIATIPLGSDTIAKIYDAKRSGIKAPKAVVNAADEAKTFAFNIVSDSNPTHKCMALLSNGRLYAANLDKVTALGGAVVGKSIEQKLALSYLYDNDKKIVSLGGKAGTGKTLLSLAAAIDQTMNTPADGKHQYNKTVVIRPLYSVGKQDLGFLPGTEAEKMEPWKQAIYDSIEGIVSKEVITEMQESNKLDVTPATFLRGRTYHDSFLIVDEAQNFEPTVLLTILSRLGKNSKIVFLWDATQKDNLSIGYNDGIVSVVDKLKSYDTFAHISLKKSERSDVAEIAGTILEDYLQ